MEIEWNATLEEARAVVRAGVLPSNVTENEAKQYLHICKKHDIDPLSRMLVPLRMGGKHVYHMSIDGLRSRAAATGEYAGSDVPVFEDVGDDLLCTVVVYRMVSGQRCPFGAQALLSEYSTGRNLWASKPRIMLAKVAESLALRKGYPEKLSGLYEASELGAES